MNENHEQGYLDLERFLAFEPRNLGSSLRSAGSQLCDLDAFSPGTSSGMPELRNFLAECRICSRYSEIPSADRSKLVNMHLSLKLVDQLPNLLNS